MTLYSILKDRASVNILKILYDKEYGKKNGHTMNYDELIKELKIEHNSETLRNLQETGLIGIEDPSSGGILSVTAKGKAFIEQFDKLVEVFNGKKDQAKAYSVKYNLTQDEEMILLICAKRRYMTLDQLAAEFKGKKSTISKTAKKLEGLNLILRGKDEKNVVFNLTETGERVVRERLGWKK